MPPPSRPLDLDGAILVSPGVQRFALSGAWELLRLVKVSTAALPQSLASPVPCARSYEGYDWEIVLPRPPGRSLVDVNACAADACELSVPNEAGFSYFLLTTNLAESHLATLPTSPGAVTANAWNDRVASHFLMQGTFGPTRATIANLSLEMQADVSSGRRLSLQGGAPPISPALARWMADQMAMPATLHRAYLRRRLNPRQIFLTDLGRPRGACEAGARYSRVAIRADDVPSSIMVQTKRDTEGSSVSAIYVDGVLRTEVDLAELRPWGLVSSCGNACSKGTLVLGHTYTICKVEDWLLGTISIGNSCTSSGATDEVELFNVYLSFSSLSYPTAETDCTSGIADSEPCNNAELWVVTDDSQVTLRPLSPATPWNEGVLLLEELHIDCPFKVSSRKRPSTAMLHGGHYYRFDPRLVSVANTRETPADLSGRAVPAGFGDPGSFVCSTAPKTFLNQHTCMLTHGCLPYEYSGRRLQLNSTTLREMRLSGSTIALALDNLPITVSGQTNDPCSDTGRWRALIGPCSAHGGETDTDTYGRDLLVAHIRDSPDPNPLIKDIYITEWAARRRCSAPQEAQYDVDGTCWRHTNQQNLNVFDFTQFAIGQEHGGNDETIDFYPILQIARSGATTINLPQSHIDANRVRDGHLTDYTGVGGLRYIGRLGDWIAFDALPTSVQTFGLADALGVSVSVPEGPGSYEQCGSPGEVSNDAAEGMPFFVNSKRIKYSAPNSQQEMLPTGQHDNANTPQIVHTSIALYEPDQLRQRVAWALSQVVVAASGTGSVLTLDSREMWTVFYDIFVRHAFGSYVDVLREVSYSPVMAHWLTYMDNEAWVSSGTVPDENYAREIMQLFSIGLWVLEPDGTQAVDAVGAPIPTYVNNDIVEFARIWTGFTERPVRGNIEVRRNPYTHNMHDPMLIREEWRDTFPKMNLYRGHIGDGVPLCTDLGERHFLRIGARYRYLGVDARLCELSHSVDWTTVPDVNSDNAPLFAPNASSSSLYVALCNADPATHACRFRSSIELTSNLACSGIECEMDTARLVRVDAGGSSYYFEYVPLPCVSLLFLEQGVGRFVESVASDGSLNDKLCMEPRAAVASPACCTAQAHNCFEYPCAYVEDRITYESALQRCERWYNQFTSPPPPRPSPPLPPSPPDFWSPNAQAPPPAPPSAYMLWPFEYMRSDVSTCPEGSSTPTEETCLASAISALANGAEPHFDAPLWMRMFPTSNANRPRGCIVYLKTGQVMYNTHATGGGSNSYKLVCSTDMAGATNYSSIGGSGMLCPHKRTACQRNPDPGRGCRANTVSETVYGTYWWSEEPCRLQVQVHPDGRVARVDPGSAGRDEKARRLQPNSENWFRVRWNGGAYPAVASGCADSCAVHHRSSGDTCLCDVSTATVAVFTDASSVPSKAQVEQLLLIGAPQPEHFDDGAYVECQTNACASVSPAVRVWTRGSANAPLFDERAIFSIVVNQTDGGTGRRLHLANKASTVTLAHGGDPAAYSYRNPPHFMTLFDATQRDAIYETDALLDHLFFHQNVGAFVGYRLIQHLITSNPSPRYMHQAVRAFQTGSYGGRTYSGSYGDLGAMVAAIMLDREARSLVLHSDPTHGHMREPLEKLLHLMRALEARPNANRAIEFEQNLVQAIGQGVYRAPSVFNFYQPEFAPSTVAQIGLVAPEAQLGALPFVIGLIDGANAMILDGFSSCEGGLFSALCHGTLVPYPAEWNSAGFAVSSDGFLTWSPADATSAAAVVDELDLLLTGGRLDNHARAIMFEEYEWVRSRSMCPNDRSAELCGRLTPGQTLAAGDRLINADGEELCFSYDGVARHIFANGTEAFSTAPFSRERGSEFEYRDAGFTRIRQIEGTSYTSLWKSDDFFVGSNRAFHSFLSGTCELHDQRTYEMMIRYRYNTGGSAPSMITCSATNTCVLPPPPPPSAEYVAVRARTDAAYAARIIQTLFVSSAAFAVTNEPRTSATLAPSPPIIASFGRPYKALVLFFMRGGADTFNLIVPTSGCDDRQLQQQYADTRGAVALTSTLEIDVADQPCSGFGVHPEMSTLQTLYNDGDLSFTANVGSLVHPTTKAEYTEASVQLPPQLFAHNTQQRGAESLIPQEAFGDGIVGRIVRVLEEQALAEGSAPLKTAAYAITPNTFMFRGMPTDAVILSEADGMLTYEGSHNAKNAGDPRERNRTLTALRRIVSNEVGSIYAQAHNAITRTSLADSEAISGILAGVSLSQDWASAISRAPTSSDGLTRQLEQVSRVIAQRAAFDAERDIFLVEMGNFDTHADILETTAENFRGADIALATFVDELKALGVWDQVTLQAISEFGRTMTNNGRGTDHAWGGNYFTMGGSVRGGVVHGTFPELRVDGPDSISSTGQMLPSKPWEALWRPLASWLGVSDEWMDVVMPNLRHFTSAHLLNASAVFESSESP